MGFRFRKSVRIAPGLKVNLGLKGASLSIGRKGATVNVGRNGVRGTVGIPGSGISYSETLIRRSSSNSARGSSTSGGGGMLNKIFLASIILFVIVFFLRIPQPVESNAQPVPIPTKPVEQVKVEMTPQLKKELESKKCTDLKNDSEVAVCLNKLYSKK
jgi:hypothetical protein